MRNVLRTSLIALALGGLGCTAAFAQGLQTEGAIEAIVGSEVREQESTASADHGKIIEAIDRASDSARAARMATDVASVEIVFLTDSTTAEGGPPADIQEKLAERETEVDSLRQEIEGNALLFHAIDSRQILMRDVLAVEFGDDKRVVVYAAGKPPG